MTSPVPGTSPDPDGTPEAEDAAEPEFKPQRPATLVFTQSVLALQALSAVFALLAVFGLNRAGEVDVPPGLMWGGGLGLILALGYASSKQKTRWGRMLGWVLQAPMIVAGIIEPIIAVIGVMFLVLWVMGLRLGSKIDRERAERDAEHRQ